MIEFEERADQLSLEEIEETLADGQFFKSARRKLLSKGAKLLVGPRGTGKTHLMRHTYAYALRTPKEPVVLYASFNQYLNLEPLLKKSIDALSRFHSWVIAKILISAFEYLELSNLDSSVLSNADGLFDKQRLDQLTSLLERGSGEEIYEEYGKLLTVKQIHNAVSLICSATKRPRAVLLLDDAALTLAEPYLIAFFEIFRLLKTTQISPKASVYPGSTQYGPTFHAAHEADEIHIWLSIQDPEYSGIMGQIAERRLSDLADGNVSESNLEVLKYASFGIPRRFLTLLRHHLDVTSGTQQQRINKLIDDQLDTIEVEYDSFKYKFKQFTSIIDLGRTLFDRAYKEVAKAQQADSRVRHLILGLEHEEDRGQLASRMLKFLVEVGMLYPLQSVSHGENRMYDRYIPHFAFLYRKGWKKPPSVALQIMRLRDAKHPIRRSIGTLLGPGQVEQLKLNLPECKHCGTARINESQRFCHQCGAELITPSLFEECMDIVLSDVPGISEAMIRRLKEKTKLKTVGDIYASQRASSDLQQAKYVGHIRAEQIIRKVELVVTEFLS